MPMIFVEIDDVEDASWLDIEDDQVAICVAIGRDIFHVNIDD